MSRPGRRRISATAKERKMKERKEKKKNMKAKRTDPLKN